MNENVDRRVVEMQFDNKEFENNIRESMKSLDALKDSLDLKASAKQLTSFERTANRFSLDKMAEAADAVSTRFSAMGIVGDQIIRNLTNVAYRAAAKVKSVADDMFIRPVSTGFQEYETQINAIQTILSNTRDAMTKAGKTDAERLEIVNDRLDQLNHYADKTIYNFTEMTNNIGRFTAAGVELDTAVSSIQGIANLAAVSGSTSEQASRAMYQLSQAISSGTVKLMDWNSVVNAGMGGEIFQKALIRTAKAMGIVVDQSKPFRETLQDGWLTSDVLTKTLEQFSWDFEEIAKNTFDTDAKATNYIRGKLEEEGKTLEEANAIIANMTDLSVEAAKQMKKAELLASGYSNDEADEIIRLAQDATEAATKVKTFTQLFSTLKEAAQSGWTQTWEYIIGDYEEAKTFLTSISDYFGGLINTSAEARNAIVKGWKDLGGRDDLISGFRNILESVRNIAKIVKDEFRTFFPPATSEQLHSITASFKSITERIKEFTADSDKMALFRGVIRGIAMALSTVKKLAISVYQVFKSILKFTFSLASNFNGIGNGLLEGFFKMVEAVKSSKKVQEFLQWITTAVPKARDALIQFASSAGEKLREYVEIFTKSGFSEEVGEWIGNLLDKIPALAGRVRTLSRSFATLVRNSEVLQELWHNAKSFFQPILSFVTDLGDKLKEGLSAFFAVEPDDSEPMGDRLKKRIDAFASAFGEWYTNVKAAGLNVWNRVKTFFRTLFTKSIPDFFTGIFDSVKTFLGKAFEIDWVGLTEKLLGFYIAIKAAQRFRSFSNIGTGIKNIGKSFKTIAKAFKKISKDGLEITKITKQGIGKTLLQVAAAIGILVASIYAVAKMDTGNLTKGLFVISVLAGELLTISLLFGHSSANGKSLLMMAAAVTLLLIPIKALAQMPTEDAWSGILRIGAILAELALFTRLAGAGFKGKTGFIGLSVAVTVLVYAIKNLADLPIESLIKGLAALGVLMLELGFFMQKAAGIGKVSGFIGLSVAINLMVLAMKGFEKMKITTILKAVLGIGAIVGSFALISKSMSRASLGKSLVLLLTMAGSLILFVKAFKEVENLDLDGALKFAAAISGVMLALSIAMKVISTIPLTGALSGVLGFGVILAGLGAIVYGIGYLNENIESLTPMLESGGNALGALGTALGKFVGGILGGVMQGIDLPQIGTDLTNFINNAMGFFDGCRGMDETMLNGVLNMCGAIIAIAGAEFISSLSNIINWFGLGSSPMEQFVDDIMKLANGLSAFGWGVLPLILVPKTAIDNAVSLAAALASITVSISGSSNGLLDTLGDIVHFGYFTSSLTTLAKGLIAFATETNGLESYDKQKMTDLVEIGGALANLEKNLEGQGGLEDTFKGIKSLAAFGKELAGDEETDGFVQGLNKFITEVQGLEYDSGTDKEKIKSVLEIATYLSELEKGLDGKGGLEDVIEGTKSLILFGNELAGNEETDGFVQGLNKFITEVRKLEYNSDTDKGKIDSVLTIATDLSELEKGLEAQGGIKDAIAGSKSLSDFSAGLPTLGSGLKNYIARIREINYDTEKDGPQLDGVLKIAETLTTFEKTLNPEGGLKQAIIGTKDLGTFATNIEKLGTAVATYMTAIAGVELKEGQSLTTPLEAIQGFIEQLNPSGGLWKAFADFFGEGNQMTTLLDYANSMRRLGIDLSVFSSSMGRFDMTRLDTAKDSYIRMGEILDELRADGQLIKWDPGKLNTNTGIMKAFGDNFKDFADGIANANVVSSNMDGIVTVYTAFKEFNDTANGWGDITVSQNINDFSMELMKVAGALREFANPLLYVDIETISKGANAIYSLVSSVVAVNGLDDMSITNLQALLTDLATLTIPNFENLGTDSGTGFVTAVIAGIQIGTESFVASVRAFSISGSTAAGSTYTNWKAGGYYLALGLRNGILAGSSSIVAAAVTVANNAVNAFRTVWDEHSPSRVGEDLGANFDLGIANGLSGYSKVVSSTAGNMAASVVASARTMLGANGSIFDNLDPNPTIRPVIDLTDVQNGASRIAGMFGGRSFGSVGFFQSDSARRNLGSLNANGAPTAAAYDDRNVISRLNALDERLAALGERIGNMRLVMDSGEVVGAISERMDNELGVLAMRKSRGN